MLIREVLCGGRRLTLRPVQPVDVDGLETLFRTLSEDDRYRRFFTTICPSRRLLERFANTEADGGFRMVAVNEDGHIVAEAGFGPPAEGDAEFSVTVSPHWRGWLGPYLLNLLVEEAGQHGVKNLEAVILTANRTMLAVVAARGCAVIDHPDWTVVQIAIGVADGMPVWPGKARHPRLLVESPALADWSGTAAARAHGFTVIGCPISSAVRHRRCPALGGRACPLAAGADAIVVAQGIEDRSAAALLEAHRRLHGAVPVFLETATDGERPPWAPPGIPIIDRRRPAAERVAELAAAVSAISEE